MKKTLKPIKICVLFVKSEPRISSLDNCHNQYILVDIHSFMYIYLNVYNNTGIFYILYTFSGLLDILYAL